MPSSPSLKRSSHFYVLAIAGGKEVRADQREEQVAGFKLFRYLRIDITTRQYLPVRPGFN